MSRPLFGLRPFRSVFLFSVFLFSIASKLSPMPTTVNPPNPSPPADDLSMPPMSVPPAEPAITGCGILLGLGVLLFAAFFAVASIYARRTRLEKTREVFGDDTITALQLADQVHLLPGEGQDFEPVELTGTPGLGIYAAHCWMNGIISGTPCKAERSERRAATRRFDSRWSWPIRPANVFR